MAAKWQGSSAAMTRRVSLTELAESGIQLRPAEAVAIVSEVCRRRETGVLHGVPPPGIIRLTADGEIAIEGPVTTGEDVGRAAQLLNTLVGGSDAVPEYRASGAMRLVIMRALGTLDLPPYRSLAEFRHALDRFASQEAYETARALFLEWDRARATHALRTSEPGTLTISDIRRARRATGLTLDDVASIAEVPALQLRDLEWGYMRSWRPDAACQAQLVRYARAAGLDEGLVVSIAWPMIEAAAESVPPAAVPVTTALVPAACRQIAVVDPPRPAPRIARRLGWVAAAVAAALIAIASVIGAPSAQAPAHGAVVGAPASVQIAAREHSPAPVVVQTAAREHSPAPLNVQTAARQHSPAPVIVAAAPRPATARVAPEPRRRVASPAKKRQTRNASFFDREVIRLVFR